MNKRNSSAGTKDEQRDAADNSTSASIEQNGLLADVPMWEHLYGKLVKMNDRFETECYWIKELAIINNGRWEPKEV